MMLKENCVSFDKISKKIHIVICNTLGSLQPETSLDFSLFFCFLNLPQNIHFLVFFDFMDIFWKKNRIEKISTFQKSGQTKTGWLDGISGGWELMVVIFETGQHLKIMNM